ncbi:MAG TPA: FAD-binding oxidoreductase, partial [Acidimicrobiaceae bacterium]|nr:FAD-binding oxidoreductase [Acidimicrobiaceae bacterium]
MVATNAGGVNVLRYGDMRAQVVGVEAVLADGTVLSHMGGLAKDNTGYHLAGLFTGSEGTLAVVTAVRLRLHPLPTEVVTAMLALPSASAAVAAAAQLRRELDSLHALEAVFDGAMALVSRHLGSPPPVGAELLRECPAAGGDAAGGDAAGGESGPVWLLAEAAGRVDPADDLVAALARLDVGAAVPDHHVAVALDPTRRRRLWAFREQMTEAVNAAGTPHKLDVTLAPDRLAEFVANVPAVVRSADAGATTVLFGHLGDGNVHVNVLGAGADGGP